MKYKNLIVALFVCTTLGLSSCAIQQNAQADAIKNCQVKTVRSPLQTFNDLNNGVQVHVITTPTSTTRTGYTHYLSGSNKFTVPTVNYVRSMGLEEMNPNTDYNLYITVKRAEIDGYKGNSYVDLEASLKDFHNNVVFSQDNISISWQNMRNLFNGFNEAYTQALEQINWNRIASFLRIEKLAKDEPNKQVEGNGDTALEQTIVRWDIQSRPQGADIFWRVVSKTPEVKSTNNKYLMTTPYEATKALDIRGLTYQTSGNVRIILRCEKDGYMPQEKEFDVRMVLDQEEISAFFRLVKEEE